MGIIIKDSYLGGVFLQKAGLITAMLIWLILSGKIINSNIRIDNDVVSVFTMSEYDAVEVNVTGFGEYGTMYLTDDEKMDILVKIAKGLGLEPGYRIDDKENGEISEKILMKKSRNADTVIRVITVQTEHETYYETTQYVEISLDFKDNVQSAESYSDLIEEIFTAESINGKSMINLKGYVKGALNFEEREHIADNLLKMLDAKIVSQNRESDLFTIYAYSDSIDNSIICAGQKVNINIAEEYDEINNRTIIYLSTPLNNLDY